MAENCDLVSRGDADLFERFFETRRRTEALAAPLSPEDMAAQAFDDASPTKWHLAHTSWFFETFVFREALRGYRVFDEDYAFLFNSYYEHVGPRHPRPMRGLLTRPSCWKVLDYRAHVDDALARLCADGVVPAFEALIALGIAHEEQHQELMLTDILALFAQNPSRPAYGEQPASKSAEVAPPQRWTSIDGGVVWIGRDDRFAFDNETPPHRVFLEPFRLAQRLVTNGEWLDFIADGGYARPTLWLSDGWATAQRNAWRAPLYWEERDGRWLTMTLRGMCALDPAAPVAHVSYYEADAFARWAGKRLPAEAEWEHAAAESLLDGNLLDSGALRPLPAPHRSGTRQMFGDVWEWTQSAYLPYPGYKAAAGALGEYNGKFMVNQIVLRGGSCVTPAQHIRASYRNFFYPQQRWQFAGLRLAEDGAA